MATQKPVDLAVPQTSSGSFANRFSKWARSPLSNRRSSKSTHPPGDMFHNIPEEILLIIMQFLGPDEMVAILQVNKRFHRVGVPELWRTTINKTDTSGWAWLHRAARAGDLDMVKRLITMGYNTRVTARENETPIYLAGLEGHKSVVRFLVKAQMYSGLHFNSDLCTLHAAAFLGDKALVQLILDSHNSRLNYVTFRVTYWKSMHLLHAAAWGGNPEIVRIFHSLGSPPDVEAIYHITPLHIAAFRGNLDAVKVLLRNGARVNKMDQNSRSAWSLAMGARHAKVAELLLKHGAPKCGRYKNIPSVLFARFPRRSQED